MKYIVIELQTDGSGAVANVVTSYDEQREAESKYYAVLSAAAVSALPEHAAVLMTSKGYILESRCFDRTQSIGGDE